jgi:uncharacterized protein YkwD
MRGDGDEAPAPRFSVLAENPAPASCTSSYRRVKSSVVTLLAAAAIAMALLGAPGSAHASMLPPTSVCPGQTSSTAGEAVQERAMLCLIDHFRAAQGLSQLNSDRELHSAAKAKSRAIVRCDQFSHEACGHPFTWWFKNAGFLTGSWSVGENIEWSGASSPYEVHSPRSTLRDWIHSPEHLANLMNPAWRDQGVAVKRGPFEGEHYASVWVSQFGVHQG